LSRADDDAQHPAPLAPSLVFRRGYRRATSGFRLQSGLLSNSTLPYRRGYYISSLYKWPRPNVEPAARFMYNIS
jgi:hypothetical protein